MTSVPEKPPSVTLEGPVGLLLAGAASIVGRAAASSRLGSRLGRLVNLGLRDGDEDQGDCRRHDCFSLRLLREDEEKGKTIRTIAMHHLYFFSSEVDLRDSGPLFDSVT